MIYFLFRSIHDILFIVAYSWYLPRNIHDILLIEEQ
jgi:hypothetical protein